jgi:hypothetical protein
MAYTSLLARMFFANLDSAELLKALLVAVLYLKGDVVNHAGAVIGYITWSLCL